MTFREITDADLIVELREEIDRLRNENEAVNERLLDAERALGAKAEPDEPYTR